MLMFESVLLCVVVCVSVAAEADHTLHTRMLHMEQTLSAMMDNVDKLERENAALKVQLQTEQENVTAMIFKLEVETSVKFDKVERENVALKTQLRTEQQHVTALNSKVERIKIENVELKEALTRLQENELISFTASATGNDVIISGVIPFSETVSNQGGHYDSDNYTFTCPEDTMYFFTYSLYAEDLQGDTSSYQVAGQLMVGGEQIVENRVSLFNSDYGVALTVTGSAVVMCAAGDQVYVEASDYGGNAIMSAYPRTTFTGFKL